VSARVNGDGRSITFDLPEGETLTVSGDPEGRVILLQYVRPWGKGTREIALGLRQPDVTTLAEAVKRLAKGRPLADLAARLDE